MKILHEILKKVYQDSGVLFAPADRDEIHKISFLLKKSGLRPLPNDYVELLLLTNGLVYNGLELFALTEQERENGAFKHRGIIQVQPLYKDHPILAKKIILGFAPEEIIIYDYKSMQYQIADAVTGQIFLKLPTFLDVFYYYIKPLLSK